MAGAQPPPPPPGRRRSSSSASSVSSAASTLGPPSSTASSPLLNPISSTASSSRDPSGSALLRHRRRRRYCGGGSGGERDGASAAAAGRRARAVAFAAAILSTLCAGSITVFSLYGHLFQSRLRYTQFEVNGVAVASSLSLYIPVPLLGYLCDRVGPAPLSLGASALFAVGYSLAAGVFASVDSAVKQHRHPLGFDGHSGRLTATGGEGVDVGREMLLYLLMIVAFVCIGVGTASMYLSAVATCAKNFGKGRHRGLALAAPIAAFGLSGMWLSQFGSRVLYERMPDGSHGDLDVVRFFIFLAAVLAAVGLVGFFGLRVVDEEELIDDAVDELERSGLLDSSALFTPTLRPDRTGYGTVERPDPFESLTGTLASSNNSGRAAFAGSNDDASDEQLQRRLLDSGNDDDDDENESLEARLKKAWVLDAETRRFLTDHTMWLFAAGFFFMVGPGEAFINNMGTVIQTLYPPAGQALNSVTMAGVPTTAATHVSIVGVASTVARLLTGTLTDLLAPSPHAQHVQLSGSQILNDPSQSAMQQQSLPRRFSTSRVVFLILFAVVLSVGLAALASGLAQNHGERFWIVSSLVGAGYGAVFSLTPIIITVIWGVENFATNWGIVATTPALGATLWGLIYSAVYEAGADAGGAGDGGDNGDIFCYGTKCYAPTFWAMTVSVWVACALVMFAWKGRNGWSQRGIVI